MIETMCEKVAMFIIVISISIGAGMIGYILGRWANS